MTSKKETIQWLPLICAAVLLISFFLPWMAWGDSKVSGYAMVSGNFFKISEITLGLENPFPKLSFTFLLFVFIPIFSALLIFLAGTGRKTGWLPYITGALSLSLTTLYILFTDFGLGKNLFEAMSPGIWLQLIAAIVLILFVSPGVSLLKKIAWLVVGPVFVFASFSFTKNKLMGETHKNTTDIKADYTIAANELIKEFITHDTGSNTKYSEKMLVVTGHASAVDIAADSVSTVRFADSTGSYIIFSLEKEELEKVKNIKAGDPVSLKGVCSGSIFSEILGTTSISFKRATLNKK